MSPRVILWVALAVCAPTVTSAQDAHYWSQHYATRGVLLGGAVIGSADDLGATFYNPGLMAWVNQREVLIGSNVYEYSTIRAKDQVDADLDLTSQRLSVLPNLVAGQLGWELLGGRIAYSLLTRRNVQITAKLRVVESGPPSAAPLRAGEYFFDQSLTEVWTGATWARHVGDRWGIGVSPYLAYRGQNLREQGTAQVADPAGSVASALVARDVAYSHWRLLAKAGIGYRADQWSFGVTVTTPGIGLLGSGENYLNATASNLDVNGDGSVDQILEANFQKDVEARYRDPWGIGAGGSVTVGWITFHGSAEWFGAVDEYDVLDLEPFATQTGESVIQPEARQGLKSIVNWGGGLEFAVSEERRLFLSVVSDRSAKGSRSDTSTVISTWDILHASIGSNVEIGFADLTLGFSYAWGDDQLAGNTEPGLVSDPAAAVGGGESSDIEFRRLRLLVGVQTQF